ncbi:MAG: hypothetical protein ACI9IQ_002958 [Cyclobacteriaceae bacterium]|jgi:hypothetical protein
MWIERMGVLALMSDPPLSAMACKYCLLLTSEG